MSVVPEAAEKKPALTEGQRQEVPGRRTPAAPDDLEGWPVGLVVDPGHGPPGRLVWDLHHAPAAEADAANREEIQYMLAVVHATSGNKEAAVDYLRQAIELNPDNRFLARHEASFEAFQEDDVVQQMLASPSDEPDTDDAD